MIRKTLIAAVVGGAALGAMLALPTPALRADNPPAASKEASAAFRAVVKKALPAVVSIDVKQTAKKRARRGAMRVPPQLREKLEEQGLDPDQFGMEGSEPELHGHGSGVLIRANGAVLTNNHVVEGADTARVMLQDGRTFSSKEIRRDPASDLAVILLANVPESLPFAELGDSDAMEIGDWVLAMGAPFELQGSVTKGIISAKGRALERDNPRSKLLQQDFLQTDAAINPGNSGGPLVDLDGKVVGINTAIESPTKAFAGISYAIPSAIARGVVDQLLKNGKVVRGYIGVAMTPIDADAARELGLNRNGVQITSVNAKGPARKAGVQDLDLVVSLAGKSIATSEQLAAEVMKVPVGSAVDLVVLREGKELTLRLTMEERPADYDPPRVRRYALPKGGNRNDDPDGELELEGSAIPPLGLSVEDVDGGVRIVGFGKNSLGLASGLRPGMVIERAGGKPIANAAAFAEAVKKADLAQGLLLVVRDSGNAGRMYLKIRSD